MISWLTCAISRERIVVNTMLKRMMPMNSPAMRTIIAISLLGTASSSTHWVIFGMNSAATLAIALKSSARIILYLCLPMYAPARFKCFH